MPDFSSEGYASYRQFCRELQVQHDFKDGDWYLLQGGNQPLGPWIWAEIGDMVVIEEPGQSLPKWGLPCSTSHWFVYNVRMEAVWLPTLADWLEMLEDPDRGLTLTLQHDEYWEAFAGPYGISPFERGPTVEEAVARLVMAVTRSPADPAPPSAAR